MHFKYPILQGIASISITNDGNRYEQYGKRPTFRINSEEEQAKQPNPSREKRRRRPTNLNNIRVLGSPTSYKRGTGGSFLGIKR
jgi:hypothetical protein